MGDASPTLQRAVMVVLAAVTAITLTTGIVGAVKVDSRSTGTVAAGAAQPSPGAQAQPGPQGPAPTAPTLADATTTPTDLVPAPIPQQEQVNAASTGATPNFTTPGTNPASASPPTTTRRSTTTTTPACTAVMTESTVQPGEHDTVEVSSDLHNANVGVTAHFASGDATYKAKTTGSGEAQVNINVPPNELPGTVAVDVLVGNVERCQTGFTIV